MIARVLAALLILVVATAGTLALSPPLLERAYSLMRQDNARVQPFEMAPGLYYVGSSDIAVYALKTDHGLIVIDGGYAETAPQVMDNLKTLGFALRDVKVLLNTHAHFDHAGGLAALKRETGAELYASPRDAKLLGHGGKGDFFLGDFFAYEPVAPDHMLADGEHVTLGATSVTAHFTPGHTKGCTSWSFDVELDGKTTPALLNCSLSILSYRLIGNAKYPEIADDFRSTFAKLRALDCDIFLAPHGRQFGLEAKRARVGASAGNPFVDPQGCRDYIAESERLFEELFERQRG